jgi:hypothetical protein
MAPGIILNMADYLAGISLKAAFAAAVAVNAVNTLQIAAIRRHYGIFHVTIFYACHTGFREVLFSPKT